MTVRKAGVREVRLEVRAPAGGKLAVRVRGRVPDADGRPRGSSKLLASVNQTLKKAGKVVVTVKLAKKYRPTLKRAGAIAATAAVELTPKTGKPSSARYRSGFGETLVNGRCRVVNGSLEVGEGLLSRSARTERLPPVSRPGWTEARLDRAQGVVHPMSGPRQPQARRRRVAAGFGAALIAAAIMAPAASAQNGFTLNECAGEGILGRGASFQNAAHTNLWNPTTFKASVASGGCGSRPERPLGLDGLRQRPRRPRLPRGHQHDR